jgi:hypothetical protein
LRYPTEVPTEVKIAGSFSFFLLMLEGTAAH